MIRAGFLWICTRDGLSRFDGANFVTYRVGDRNSPPTIESIYETRDGTYWLTTPIGTFRFKGNALSRPEKTSDGRRFLNAEFVSNRRGFFYQDRAGELWYGSGMVARVSEEAGKVKWTQVPLHLPIQQFGVYRIIEAADTSKWVMTNVGAVRYLPDGRTVFYKFIRTVIWCVTSCLV